MLLVYVGMWIFVLFMFAHTLVHSRGKTDGARHIAKAFGLNSRCSNILNTTMASPATTAECSGDSAKASKGGVNLYVKPLASLI